MCEIKHLFLEELPTFCSMLEKVRGHVILWELKQLKPITNSAYSISLQIDFMQVNVAIAFRF